MFFPEFWPVLRRDLDRLDNEDAKAAGKGAEGVHTMIEAETWTSAAKNGFAK